MVHRPPSRACAHNLQYWRGLPYLAVGAGAHGYANGYRYSNALRIKTYIDRLICCPSTRRQFPIPLTPATVNHHRQSPQDDMGEFMLTGLRLTREGISAQVFRERFGKELEDVFGKEIEDLVRLRLLEFISSPLPLGEGLGVRVRLTPRGHLLGNQAFARFVQ
jgi:coproporphyrinogen III oxidase-like Fe-S oxidoreductase